MMQGSGVRSQKKKQGSREQRDRSPKSKILKAREQRVELRLKTRNTTILPDRSGGQ